jgi:hypothetical protein
MGHRRRDEPEKSLNPRSQKRDLGHPAKHFILDEMLGEFMGNDSATELAEHIGKIIRRFGLRRYLGNNFTVGGV